MAATDFAAIPPSLLLAPCLFEGGQGLGLGGVGGGADGARPADAAPLTDQRPVAKQGWLEVELVEPRHVAGGIAAGEGQAHRSYFAAMAKASALEMLR